MPLTDKPDLFAKIDASDVSLVEAHTWHAEQRTQVSYAVAMILTGGKRLPIKMHRLILGRVPGKMIDHVNGDGLDNRRANLRHCTNRENSRNKSAYAKRKRAKGGFLGVTREESGKYCASISTGKGPQRRIRLGLFDTAEDAARAYDRAALEHFGEFAASNFEEK